VFPDLKSRVWCGYSVVIGRVCGVCGVVTELFRVVSCVFEHGLCLRVLCLVWWLWCWCGVDLLWRGGGVWLWFNRMRCNRGCGGSLWVGVTRLLACVWVVVVKLVGCVVW